jgi:DNA-binding transcriptional regulator YdaS (Cro superfamily)
MTKSVESAASEVRWRWTDRPPILEATRALGLNDRRVAKLIGVTPEAVHSWVTSRRPIPHQRLLALIFVVGRLTGEVASWAPAQTRYARRAQIATNAASQWNVLARLELMEELGGDITAHPELIAKGYELGEQALAKLERADAA